MVIILWTDGERKGQPFRYIAVLAPLNHSACSAIIGSTRLAEWAEIQQAKEAMVRADREGLESDV